MKNSAAAQQFVACSPHKVPDATVEIIANWEHGCLEVMESSKGFKRPIIQKIVISSQFWVIFEASCCVFQGQKSGQKNRAPTSNPNLEGILQPLDIDPDASLKILCRLCFHRDFWMGHVNRMRQVGLAPADRLQES